MVTPPFAATELLDLQIVDIEPRFLHLEGDRVEQAPAV
jgi:hypothetical protein